MGAIFSVILKAQWFSFFEEVSSLMNKDLVAIFDYLEREKGIKREIIIDAIRESLEMAARKSAHGGENIVIEVNGKTGDVEVFCDKIVVEKMTNPMTQISLKVAQKHVPDCELGETVRVLTEAKDLGRISAQRARQIILQKLRGAERDVIQEEYRHRVNTLVSGTVKRIGRGSCVIVDLGKVEGIMPRRNYSPNESFDVGHRVLALLSEVRDTELGGAEVVLSRTDPEFVRQLLIQEVPEVSDGTIVVEGLVREPGYRTKMIVRSEDSKVDPVGACIGVRGIRVKNIIRELDGEKIDVIPYVSDAREQLSQALNPVVIRKLEMSDEDEKVTIVVDDEDFPTTIGKKGMNIRLLGRLMNIELRVRKMSDFVKLRAIERAALTTCEDERMDQLLSTVEGIPTMVIDQLISEGYKTPRALLMASPEEVAKKLGMSPGVVDKIFEQVLEPIRKEQRE